MNFTTVFDGNLPASGNPGVDPGASVTVWTPTKDGVYQVMIIAPDEPTGPFMISPTVAVDLDHVPPLVDSIAQGAAGALAGVEDGDPVEGSATLATTLGHIVRVVVKVALVVSAEGAGEDDDMVVPLDELKAGIGIELSDVSEDENLVALEGQAAAWAEEKLERRFHAPAERIDYVKGTGTTTLFLWGNVEDADTLVVAERSRSGGGWEDLENDEDDPTFEIRRSTRVQKLERIDGSVWSRGMEYRVTWDDGYTVAPKDIKALIIEAVKLQRDALLAGSAAAAEGVIKSETIGDYSYTLDLSAAAVALNSSSLSADIQADTINRWRRVHA